MQEKFGIVEIETDKLPLVFYSVVSRFTASHEIVENDGTIRNIKDFDTFVESSDFDITYFAEEFINEKEMEKNGITDCIIVLQIKTSNQIYGISIMLKQCTNIPMTIFMRDMPITENIDWAYDNDEKKTINAPEIKKLIDADVIYDKADDLKEKAVELQNSKGNFIEKDDLHFDQYSITKGFQAFLFKIIVKKLESYRNRKRITIKKPQVKSVTS